jgi:hypothetical protein
MYYLCFIMEEPIVITVPWRGGEREFLLELQPMGYTHRFRVEIEGVEVFFEPDEERRYRAMIVPEKAEAAQKLDPALLQAVAAVLQDALG